MRRGKFRVDLYTRVNVLRIVMPPLRRILREAPDERREYVHRVGVETVAQSPETWDGRREGVEIVLADRDDREVDLAPGRAWIRPHAPTRAPPDFKAPCGT